MNNPKSYSSSYIYGRANYETPLINAIVSCNRIDKNSKDFENILIDVKRKQTTMVLYEILLNDNVILMMNSKPLPSAFKVFSAKDIKEDKQTKVFIDVTAIMDYKEGFYSCKRIDILISYLISAMTQLIYYTDSRRLLTNSTLISSSTDCFISLFSYILDYLRISGYSEAKKKIQYMIGIYYLHSVLGLDISPTTKNIAAKCADISPRDAQLFDILYREDEDFVNLNTFINRLTELFKFKGFSIEVFIEKWLYIFGTGTQFAPELFTSFATLLTDAYSGTYINNQKTIEKCCGKQMVTFSNTIITIGQSAFNKRI